MARYHYWQFLVNQEGQPINAADINVYLAGTTTPANVYTSETGTAYTNTLPQASTNELGYFEFWMGDETETYGYVKTQKWKINWERTGVTSGTIDYIDVFPPIAVVDETSSNSVKNKTVSNLLAKGWENHKDVSYEATVNTVKSSPAHNLQPVVITSETETFNKVVSNKIIYDLINNNINSYIETVSTWTSAGSASPSGSFYNTVTHGLATEFPIVEVWNNTTKKTVAATSIESIDNNNIKVTIDNDTLIAVIKVLK